MTRKKRRVLNRKGTMYRDEQAVREAFRRMGPKEKFGYILTYYWWAILLTAIAAIILGSVIYERFTKKQTVMYIGCLNVTVGSDLEEKLRQGFLVFSDENPKKTDVLLYRDMYIAADPSDADHQMAYASRMKLMAVINGKLLDLVLMNREAYDILSAADYLLDLSVLSGQDEALLREMETFLMENTVIVEDNALEIRLNEADTYQAVTKEITNGVDLSGISLVRDAGFSDSVYLGIIANTPRLEECAGFLEYLLSAGETE